MDEMLLPRTAMANLGPRRQPGLLGKGTLPSAPAMQMGAFTCEPLNIGGLYATDEYGAAMFLLSELKSPDSEMNPAEREAAALMLRDLIAKLYNAGKVSFDQIVVLQKEAESIPIIGPLLFSAANLPGTLAGVGGGVVAAAHTTSVNSLLDITPAVRKKLNAWAKTAGSNNYMKASRHFKGRVKVVLVNGKLHFDIPLTMKAERYRVLGKAAAARVQVPTYGTAKSLNKLGFLHADGAKGVAKVMGGNSVGALLAFGPQAYLDATSSNGMDEFLSKSAYSQPTNGIAFGAGVVASFVVGTILGAPLVVVIFAGLLAGAAAQSGVIESGYDKKIGDWLTK